MTVKDFAEKAEITCDEAKEIIEKVFDIIPLTDNYVLPEEVAGKIQQDFIGRKKNTKKTLEEIQRTNSTPVTVQNINGHNSKIINELIDKKFDIFVDTNFVFSPYFPEFIAEIEHTLRVRNAQIIIIEDVMQEVSKFTYNKKKCNLNGLARKRIVLLKKYIENGLFVLREEKEIKKLCGKYGFADFTFHIIFLLYRLKEQNAILLTNEKNLAIGNLMINHEYFIRSEGEIRVARINDDGLLVMRKLQQKNSQKT